MLKLKLIKKIAKPKFGGTLPPVEKHEPTLPYNPKYSYHPNAEAFDMFRKHILDIRRCHHYAPEYKKKLDFARWCCVGVKSYLEDEVHLKSDFGISDHLPAFLCHHVEADWEKNLDWLRHGEFTEDGRFFFDKPKIKEHVYDLFYEKMEGWCPVRGEEMVDDIIGGLPDEIMPSLKNNSDWWYDFGRPEDNDGVILKVPYSSPECGTYLAARHVRGVLPISWKPALACYKKYFHKDGGQIPKLISMYIKNTTLPVLSLINHQRIGFLRGEIDFSLKNRKG